jgi:hypothetical protein
LSPERRDDAASFAMADVCAILPVALIEETT